MSRLAVVDRAKLRVVEPRRRRSVDLGALGDSRLANRQPAWSPDGARIAWSAFDRRQTDSPAALAVATGEGTTRADVPVVFPPFYLAWRPDGAAIATLADGPLGLELAVVEPTTGANEIVYRGAPLFFAWGDDGALAIHAATGDRPMLDVRGAGVDAARFASLAPGAFNAPAFVGRDVLAVVRLASRPELSVMDRSGSVVRTLGTADHGSRFVVSPSSRFVAHTSERGRAGALVVHDLERDQVGIVDSRSPALFAWSPDSTSLLVAFVTEGGDFPRLAWCVWRDGELRQLTEARVTAAFAREILPFHEQFARSHSWWAPDNRSFCYAAVDDFGNDTIWIADVATGETSRAGTGSYAVWSPV